jgi:glutathione S-transferase
MSGEDERYACRYEFNLPDEPIYQPRQAELKTHEEIRRSRPGRSQMYILYGGDFTRAPLVQWVLEEGRLEYELRKIDVLKGEHRTADFLATNPAGFVPVLVTPEGDALYEVAALMVYLADRHGLTDLAPTVRDPCRGVFLSTVFNIASDIQSELKRFYYPHRFSLRREDDAGIRELAKALLLSHLDVMNTRLAKGGPYLLRDRFSLADFYISYWVGLLDPDVLRKRFPSIATLYDLVKTRPSTTAYFEGQERVVAYFGRI